jgi:thiamine transport system substrate-binding protein
MTRARAHHHPRHGHTPTRSRTLSRTVTVVTLAALATGCSSLGSDASDDEGDTPERVVLVTHESFQLPERLLERFRTEYGYDLEVRAAGDAGTLATKLSLTADNPTGDVAFGIDNTFASRPLAEGAFAEYADGPIPPGAEEYALPEGTDRLKPIDVSHVCVNVDTAWFRDEGLAPPRTLDDLTEPAYRGLFVTPAASTSSPGMAFLLSTIAEYGVDGWQDYWADLMANDTLLVDGWSDAYYTDFTAGGGDGERPIVLSYDSSPAFTVPKGSDESTTAALLDTCFRQVEYAGVLAGADNPEGAEAVVDFLTDQQVQQVLPESMYVFPASDAVDLPEDWAAHAEQPTDPYVVAPDDIAANREAWLTEWTEITTR